MKRSVIALALLIATSCSFALAQQAQQPNLTKAEEEVRKLERQWLDAYEQNNPEAMNLIVADDFIITFPNGAMQTKPQVMSIVKAPRPPSAPKMRFYTEDVRSRAYGDTVILIGIVVTEYERDGKTVKEASRYTDTYVKRKDRWQVAASHLSSTKDAMKPASGK